MGEEEKRNGKGDMGRFWEEEEEEEEVDKWRPTWEESGRQRE